MSYNRDKTLRTFRGVTATGRAHCLEAVFFTAAVLEHHGYPPTVLDIESDDGLDHVLFLFRHEGKWGTVARSRDYGLHGRRPVFSSIPALVRSYMEAYVDGSGRVNGYGVAHLDLLTRANWRLSTRSVWQVERALIDMPHYPLPMGDARYSRMLRRFMAFKESGAPVNRRTMDALYGDQTKTLVVAGGARRRSAFEPSRARRFIAPFQPAGECFVNRARRHSDSLNARRANTTPDRRLRDSTPQRVRGGRALASGSGVPRDPQRIDRVHSPVRPCHEAVIAYSPQPR